MACAQCNVLLMHAPGLCRHRSGYLFIRGKVKLHKMKNKKLPIWDFLYREYSKFLKHLTRTFSWAHISYFWRLKSSYIPGKSLSFAQKFGSTKNNTKPTFIIHHHCWHFWDVSNNNILHLHKSLLCFYISWTLKKKLSNNSWPLLHYYWYHSSEISSFFTFFISWNFIFSFILMPWSMST